MKPTTKRKRIYPHREPRLTPTKTAAIIRQQYQFTDAHLELVKAQIALNELRRQLGTAEPTQIEPPHQQLTADDAAAIASAFETWCTHEYDHRSRSIQPRRPQPHRPTPGRLDDYLGRRYEHELERRTTNTAPIRRR